MEESHVEVEDFPPESYFTRQARLLREFVTRPRGWRHFARGAGIFAGGVAAVALVLGALLVLALKTVEPEIPAGADLYAMNRPAAMTFLDQTGKQLGVRGAIVGDRLKLSLMPRYLPAAFLAMEDRKFYQHHGIDPRSLLRAAMVDLKAGHIVQGGSTITQQVVKIVFLSPDRTFWRKLQEIAGARALEQRFTKDQILEIYLNRLYLGSGAYGVDGAAHVYFGKSARNVTVAEAAMLAALTRAPTAFSPRRDLVTAQDRAGKVLDAMVDGGFLSAQQAAQARAHPANIVDQTEDLARDYFLDAAADEVKQLGLGDGDLTVTTTMDPALQASARQQIASVLNRRTATSTKASQTALVAMSPDGAVRALIGGRDYAESSFNRATKAKRQPGSAFKPFVYLAAFEHGLTPATVRVDEPITIVDHKKEWSPDNYTETHAGPVTLQDAFARSINTVAVELGQEVGLPNVISVAHRLGIDSQLEPNASLALGTSEVTPLELTSAYASFANSGRRVRPYMVVQVKKSDGQIAFRRAPSTPAQVIPEDEVLQMNSMMYQVVQAGTGHAAAVPGHEVAGKTGTSADFRDAWFVGFSPELVTGVWIGNDDFTPMKKVTGGTLPAQIWSGFMRVALKSAPPSKLPRAEPVPTMSPDMASPDSGDGFVQRGLEGIGSFFDNLFGGGNSSSSVRRDRTSENDQRFFPEENDRRYGAIDDMADAMPYTPMPPPRSQQAMEYPPPPPPPLPPSASMPESFARARTPPPPVLTQPGNNARDLHSEGPGTYVFRNGDTGQTFVYKSMPSPPRDYEPPPPPSRPMDYP